MPKTFDGSSYVNEDNKTKNLETVALLSSTSRVEAPFIRVKIGDYTFGVYEEKDHGTNVNGFYKNISAKYPNYVQSLSIQKINGTVNQYTLNISYPITQDNDPNFFDKIFSKVSQTRKISIDYGDFMQPNYIYRDEEAIITGVTESIDIQASKINYVVKATSTAALTLSGSYNFPSGTFKPSDKIFELLYRQDNVYHLKDVFTGMIDEELVRSNNLIAIDDAAVYVPAVNGISILEYISKLVNYMNPIQSGKSYTNDGVYTLTTYEDTTGKYGGPYFKVSKVNKGQSSLNQLCTYNIDIGYPTANIITDFRIKSSDNWSIYYNYNQEVSSSDYIKRIDSKGNLVYELSPMLTNNKYEVDAGDMTWWTKVTEFPIQAELTLKGLLKPAILMTYVKLNVWFYGHKHITSGYYIITSQVDKIDSNGYFTTLGLTKLAADEGL